MDKLINGKELSRQFLKKTRKKVRLLDKKPGLAIVLAGNDPSSHLYVKLKRYACESCEINFHKYVFDNDHSEQDIINSIEFLNADPETTGILVQLPLPAKYNPDNIISAMNFRKDIDGYHPINRENMQKCDYKLMPPLPGAIIELVKSTGTQIENKNIVILCNSPLFADPLNCVGGKKNKVQVVTLKDDWEKATKQADILIVGVGKPKLITKDKIKKHAIIIDVGINQVGTEKQVIGDVDIDDVLSTVDYITPVPGGVGPMTIAILLKNLAELKTF